MKPFEIKVLHEEPISELSMLDIKGGGICRQLSCETHTCKGNFCIGFTCTSHEDTCGVLGVTTCPEFGLVRPCPDHDLCLEEENTPAG